MMNEKEFLKLDRDLQIKQIMRVLKENGCSDIDCVIKTTQAMTIIDEKCNRK